MHKWILLYCILCFLWIVAETRRTFKLDTEKRLFIKNGKPFQYASGSLHYARVPPHYWKDRLSKIKAANLNTVQTYVMWNVHEKENGKFQFSGQANLEAFINATQAAGLYLIVRAGPYVCAEWEFGGLPWFLANKNITVRSSDENYMFYVKRWLRQLLPRLQRNLYVNGGNIILVQVENEYGSYNQCDKKYMKQLYKIFRKHLGNELILFTTDSAPNLKCGSYPKMFATVDFGYSLSKKTINDYFNEQNKYGVGGPRVNSEYYSGWLVHWGDSSLFQTNISKFIQNLDFMLLLNASVNIYMLEGGTNFGYWSGANSAQSGSTLYDITSYDYSAPITESGDITSPFYYRIKDLLAKRLKNFNITVPRNTTKTAYASNLSTAYLGSAIHLLERIATHSVYTKKAMSMEDLGCGYGFILYETHSPTTYEKNSQFCVSNNTVRDSASVFVKSGNGLKFFGTIFNNRNSDSCLTLEDTITKNDILYFLVQNQGRINFAKEMNDQRKGIVGEVIVNNKDKLYQWKNTVLNITNIFQNFTTRPYDQENLPGFYVSSVIFEPGDVNDTFIMPNNFKRGFILVNGFNLGRYWPEMGPQKTLYIPKYCLKAYPLRNVFVIFELEVVDNSATSISFFKEAIWNN